MRTIQTMSDDWKQVVLPAELQKLLDQAQKKGVLAKRLFCSFVLPGSLVLVGEGLAEAFWLKNRIICDANVVRLHPEMLKQNFLKIIRFSEEVKTLETVQEIWKSFCRAGLGRQSVVCSCGGGVAGDLVGFAAATWMRGIPWMNQPTTLLAMVDASVGGKTGCDLPEGKNLVGAFHAPSLVVIDPTFLKTLPEGELRSGFAEMIKHQVIGGKGRKREYFKGIPTVKQIADSLAVKVRIVQQDPYETKGKRVLLNCGHTVGHALESATHYRLSHGEAVAIGCVEEARMAVSLGLATEQWPLELAEHFQRGGLPTELPQEIRRKLILDFILRDKKQQDGRITFALPCGWGDVRPIQVPVEELKS